MELGLRVVSEIRAEFESEITRNGSEKPRHIATFDEETREAQYRHSTCLSVKYV